MTRRMADSVAVANLPEGFDLYAAYVDGMYENYNDAAARFGSGKVVPIAVSATTNAGIVGDCENGDMTPQSSVQWVVSRRNAGVDPTIYCSEAAWAAVRQAFNDDKVPEPHYWIAGYPGSVGEALYPGSVAHQWIDHGPYDESVVADYWPGVDPPPHPTPDQAEGDNVTSWQEGGQNHIAGVVNGKAYHWWQWSAPDTAKGQDFTWHPEVLETP